jgi:hypothetical protein
VGGIQSSLLLLLPGPRVDKDSTYLRMKGPAPALGPALVIEKGVGFSRYVYCALSAAGAGCGRPTVTPGMFLHISATKGQQHRSNQASGKGAVSVGLFSEQTRP